MPDRISLSGEFAAYVADGRCPCCGRTEPIWTPAAIVDRMRAWFHQHGNAPSTHDWRKASVANPSADQVIEVFGSFDRARRAAGLVFHRSNQQVWTRDQIVEAITRWRFLHGRLPRAHEWNNQSGEFPSTKTVRRLFGSWNGAIVAAGYEPSHARRSARGYRAVMAATTKRVAA